VTGRSKSASADIRRSRARAGCGVSRLPRALDDGTAAEARRLLERTLGLGVDLADSFARLAEAGERSVRLAHLAVRELPTSGTSDELLDAGISARHIVEASHSIGNEA
jgi:hypothetical protein